jgi:hypothetical protein
LLSAGMHPKVVQERLGHSQISVALDTYSHVVPTLQLEAARKLDELLSSELATNWLHRAGEVADSAPASRMKKAPQR